MKPKILLILGTRPEAIKLAPLFKAFKQNNNFETLVCATAQHRQMLDQVLDFFKIKPDIDLNLMKPNQTLPCLTAELLTSLTSVFSDIKPSMILVQGDTTTAFAAALAAFYQKIHVGHVEAGLRTQDIYSPFPEEVNRRLVGVVAKLHFVPTQRAANLLIKENYDKNSIFITGNTVVDALFEGLQIIENDIPLQNDLNNWYQSTIKNFRNIDNKKSRLILITGHRRESFGEGFLSICQAIKTLSQKYPDDSFVYPVHLNPNVTQPVKQILSDLPNVYLMEPIDYPRILFLMKKSYLILTDSGGIQEEAPSLKVPVLVMREKTERPEGVEIGTSILVGNTQEKIIDECSSFLDNLQRYKKAQVGKNPYGNGNASQNIVKIVEQNLIQ